MTKFWAMEETYLRNYLEKIGNLTIEERQAIKNGMISIDRSADILNISGETAEISITGRLARSAPEDICLFLGYDGTGYDDISAALDEIENSDQVKRIVLKINSPGGEIDGLDEIYQRIFSLRGRYRITAENHGLMASAAYYIAAAADKIVAMSPAALTGSIGVMSVLWDKSRLEDRIGVKKVVIISRNAPKKVPYNEEGLAAIQDEIDSLERIFVQRVAEGRGIDSETVVRDFGQGGCLVAGDPMPDQPDAVSVGMIDEVRDGIKNERGEWFAMEKKNNKTVEELMEENSRLVAEMEELKKLAATQTWLQAERKNDAEKAAFEAGKAELQLKINKVRPWLDAKYPDAIRSLAGKVLAGESSFDALEGAVTVYDMMTETDKIKEAIGETEKLGETPSDNIESISKDGNVNNEIDFFAAVDRLRPKKEAK